MKVDWSTFWPRIVEATGETITMVIGTLIFSSIVGIALGLLLYVTREGNILENRWVAGILNFFINIIRPIPFIILLFVLSPVTREVVGTTIGTAAAVFPMTIAASFVVARVVENNLVSIDPGVIEAAEAMGSSSVEIIFRVYLKEGLPSIIRVSSVTIVNLIGLTTMAGAIGGGGLGNLAIARGYNRNQADVTLVSTAVILIIVFASQFIGNRLVKKTSH